MHWTEERIEKDYDISLFVQIWNKLCQIDCWTPVSLSLYSKGPRTLENESSESSAWSLSQEQLAFFSSDPTEWKMNKLCGKTKIVHLYARGAKSSCSLVEMSCV